MKTVVIELVSDGCYLSKHRGFLRVEKEGRNIRQVPLADVAAVIAGANASTWSQAALASLSANGVPVVICGERYLPIGVLWPLGAHYESGARIRAQLALKKPAAKRAWQAIVKAKIAWQAEVLRLIGVPNMPLWALVSKVRSGDPTNVEAQAARRYWTLLFGRGFRRNREQGGINSLLNYGYTVLRSAGARAVVGAGLHPTPAFGHTNRGNVFALVDDLIEPFRPQVDRRVHEFTRLGVESVNADAKRRLVDLLYEPITFASTRPLAGHIHVAAQSIASYCLGDTDRLALPDASRPPRRKNEVVESVKTAVGFPDDVDACFL